MISLIIMDSEYNIIILPLEIGDVFGHDYSLLEILRIQ